MASRKHNGYFQYRRVATDNLRPAPHRYEGRRLPAKRPSTRSASKPTGLVNRRFSTMSPSSSPRIPPAPTPPIRAEPDLSLLIRARRRSSSSGRSTSKRSPKPPASPRSTPAASRPPTTSSGAPTPPTATASPADREPSRLGHQPIAVSANPQRTATMSTTYLFRVVAANSDGTTEGPDLPLPKPRTQPACPNNRPSNWSRPQTSARRGQWDPYRAKPIFQHGRGRPIGPLPGARRPCRQRFRWLNTFYMQSASPTGWQSSKVSPPSLVPAIHTRPPRQRPPASSTNTPPISPAASSAVLQPADRGHPGRRRQTGHLQPLRPPQRRHLQADHRHGALKSRDKSRRRRGSHHRRRRRLCTTAAGSISSALQISPRPQWALRMGQRHPRRQRPCRTAPTEWHASPSGGNRPSRAAEPRRGRSRQERRRQRSERGLRRRLAILLQHGQQ